MKHLIHIFCLSFTFLLSACTAYLWDNKPVKTTYTEKQQSDTIRAFGKIQEKSQDRIIMMGDQYWYIISANNTPELLTLLNTRLPKAFQTQGNGIFDIKIHEDATTFESSFILDYYPKNAKEVKILKDLGFRRPPDENVYKKYVELTGEIYRANKDIRKDYQFETALPVSLKMTTKTTEVEYLKLIGKIAATPLTIAYDTIFLIPNLILIHEVKNFRVK